MGSLVVYRKIFAVVVLGLVGAFTLSGCWMSNVIEQSQPLPDEERYQFINEAKDGLRYKEAGEVVSEQYDTADGVFAPSYFYAEVKGEDAFDLLTARARELATRQCDALSPTQTRCSSGQVDIRLTRESTEDLFVTVEVIDGDSGRTPSE
jgi:hypothetical protein